MNRRSDEPVYWGLFGAGGMAIAFALPALIVMLIVCGFNSNAMANLFELFRHWWTAIPLFGVLALTTWHCLHRIYHGLHDLTIHTTRLHHYVCYGLAGIISVVTGFGMFLIYFE